VNEDKHPMVLIVEDNALLAELVCDALAEHNLRSQVARSAQGGLEALEMYPDLRLALVDYRLTGGADGLEFVRGARSLRPEVTYVLMTGTPQSFMPGLPQGIELLPKPFALAKLIELVKRSMKEA
jgi:DNA-binding response OmpR family regulator